MAKKRLKIKDKQGNVVDYDISSASVTIDIEGKSLDVKLSEIATALLQAVTEVTFNGTPYNRENGKINLGQQMQADWNENNTNWPAYIRNKPNSVVNEMLYDQQSRKVRQRRNGVVEDVFTLPEEGSQVTFDEQMSSTSENGVQNKVIKAYVDAVSQRIDTLIGSGNVQGAIDTFNEVVAFLNGISSSDTLAATIATLNTAINSKPSTSEVNAAIQEAVEGLGGGSVESVTINGVNHEPINGVVDLGTIQGAKGDKGEKGDTVVIDPEGLEQFTIANDLDTSDPTQGLSARQGKILKQAISTVQANLQAVVEALANMAFTSAKPALNPIDWTGGTFYATIVKSLTGCTATDNTTNGQIAEGSTLTMQLTASSGYTLTGATISVTNSKGQSVAYTLNGSTLSVANVVGSITISVVAVAIYSVANNDTHATLSNSTPANPTHGSSWSGTLSAASGYGLSATPSVEMGGVAVDFTATGNSWDRSTGAMTIGNVTGNIIILEAAVEVVAHTITKKLLNMASNAADDTTDADFGYKLNSVVDGNSYSDTIAPVSGATYNNDLKVYVGGVLLTAGTDYTYTNNVLSIPAAKITGDVDIVATACTGVVTAKANTSGAKITITKTDNSTVELTCDTDNGDGTYSGTLNISGTVKSVAFTDKTAILEADFGGLITTDNIGGLDGNTGSPNTTIKKILGLVCTLSTIINERFKGCSALERIDTIGWSSNGYYVYAFMRGCSSLKAIDLSWLPLNNSNNDHREMFSGCAALSRIILADDLSGVTNPKGWFSNRGGDINTSTLVVSGGKMTNVTSLEDLARSCNFKKLDISFIDSDAITNMSSIFYGSRIGSLIIGNLGAGNLGDVTWVKAYAVNKLVCKSSTPPVVNPDKNWLTSLNVSNIYVPDASVNAYKAAAGWNAVTDRIHSINEYTE